MKNKTTILAEERGFKFDFASGGAFYYKKETPYDPIFFKVPKGNRHVTLYQYGELGVSFFLSRKKWLREAFLWEKEFMSLLSLNYRLAVQNKEEKIAKIAKEETT